MDEYRATLCAGLLQMVNEKPEWATEAEITNAAKFLSKHVAEIYSGSEGEFPFEGGTFDLRSEEEVIGINNDENADGSGSAPANGEGNGGGGRVEKETGNGNGNGNGAK